MEGGLALGPLAAKSPEVFGIQSVSFQPWSNRTQEEQPRASWPPPASFGVLHYSGSSLLSYRYAVF